MINPGRWLRSVVALVIMSSLVACSSAGPPDELPSDPASPSLSASRTTDRRPVQPMPDVSPPGFVDPPEGRGASRYTDQQLDWRACGDQGLECTTVRAPLDWRRPDGQAITLALAKRPATAGPRIGSLFVNPGGPGGSGVDYAARFNTKGLERYDVVGWDPRGVGASTPVVCENGAALELYLNTDDSPDDAAELTALIEQETAFGRSCLARSGALLQHISTADTVRDLDLLRALVGDAKLSYFGSSYGTEIGATYAELFPAAVGRMVLDGAVDITGSSEVSQAQGFDRALDTFADWCVRQRCRLGSSREAVLAAITGLWDRLDAQPMPSSRDDRKLTQAMGVQGVAYLLYQPESSFRYLAQALLLAIEDQDGGFLLLLADQYYERSQDGTFGQSTLAFPAIRCLDSPETSVTEARREWERLKRQAPVFGRYGGLDLVCPRWPVAPAPAVSTITGEGAAPIVVIGTTGDPATPYEHAVTMAQQLDSGVLVTWAGAGHLAYGKSACVKAAAVAYLVDGTVPRNRLRCD